MTGSLLLRKLERMTRTIAVWTSLLGVLIFCGVFFTTGSNFLFQLEQILTGKTESINLPIFLLLNFSALAGLLLATNNKHTVLGATICLVSVILGYGWCKFGLSFVISTAYLAIASPALFYIASAKLEQAANFKAKSELLAATEVSSNLSTDVSDQENTLESESSWEIEPILEKAS